VIIATSTWDSADVIEPWLRHQERLGAAAVLVMDYGSTDGTREILGSPRWSPLVRMFDVPSLQADTSNDLLAIAKADHPGTWCLYCDPDEFLVTPAMKLEDLLPGGAGGVSIVTVPRRNMTGARSAAMSAGSSRSPFGWLTLRIEQRAERTDAERFGQSELSSPWIFTAIPGKVLVQVDRVAFIGAGDHDARAEMGETHHLEGCMLLHFPFRGFERFRHKLQLARRHMAEDPPQPPEIAWQYRRWIGAPDERALWDEYESQFVDDADVPRLVRDRVVVEDTRVRDAVRGRVALASEAEGLETAGEG
jgi:hypothetical protein